VTESSSWFILILRYPPKNRRYLKPVQKTVLFQILVETHRFVFEGNDWDVARIFSEEILEAKKLRVQRLGDNALKRFLLIHFKNLYLGRLFQPRLIFEDRSVVSILGVKRKVFQSSGFLWYSLSFLLWSLFVAWRLKYKMLPGASRLGISRLYRKYSTCVEMLARDSH
jgi:hypothetical protein